MYQLNKTLMKDLLKTLIAYPTVSTDTHANAEALTYIATYLEKRGMFVARYSQNGHDSIVATTRNTKSPRVMLGAHLDVVPAPPTAFQMTEDSGRLYGAGICDMKFAIASYMQLVDELQDNLHDYDFGIMIVTDEEIGGRDGAKYLLETQGYRTKVCLIPDGGNDWVFEIAAKGVIWMTATATGVAAHASQPWNGENAIEKLLLFLGAVKRDLFVEQGPLSSTCNIGKISGGATANQVPDTCSADIDIRCTTQEEQTHILEKITAMSQDYGVDCVVHFSDSAIQIDLANPYVIAFTRHMERVLQEPLQTMRSNGGSDARYFAAYGIPTLVTYPVGGERHGGREWLEEKSLYQFHDILKGFVNDPANAKTPEPAELLTFSQ